jgi:hypothetical protein
MPWRYEELKTAKEWGLCPQAFDGLPDEEKAEMLAFEWAKGLLEAYTYSKIEADSSRGRRH